MLYPKQGVAKRDLANYYAEVAQQMLPWIERRPLTLLRCPEGRDKACFYQKHPGSLPGALPRVSIPEKSGSGQYIYVRETADIVSLVQWGTLEFHVWGCRVDDIEHPDMLVFDLDPDPKVSWNAMVTTARELRDTLGQLGLQSFLRTTGGKGLHLVAPLLPGTTWERARAFARAVAERQADAQPEQLTVNMARSKRRGRIFIDYLRNARGNTAIVNFSARARPGAPVAVPVRWDELNSRLSPDKYRIDNVRRRISALAEDPWSGFEKARRKLTANMFEAVGLHGEA